MIFQCLRGTFNYFPLARDQLRYKKASLNKSRYHLVIDNCKNQQLTMNNLKKFDENQILFKCEICDKEFKNSNGLKRHFKFVHRLEKEYQCNICQNVYKLKDQLTLHVRSVHDNKKYH